MSNYWKVVLALCLGIFIGSLLLAQPEQEKTEKLIDSEEFKQAFELAISMMFDNGIVLIILALFAMMTGFKLLKQIIRQ